MGFRIFSVKPGVLSNELIRQSEYTTTITGRDRTVFPESTVILTASSFPPLQVKSTVMPPRIPESILLTTALGEREEG